MTTSKFKISNKVLSVLLCLAMLLSYLPLSSLTAFAAETPVATGYCNNTGAEASRIAIWELSTDGTLTIKKSPSGGTGMSDFAGVAANRPSWESYKDQIKKVVIEDDITSLGSYAFYQYTALEEVVIGDGIQTIKALGFCRCTKLTKVTIGSSVKEIQPSAFNGCTSLADVTLPNGITTICTYAFANCPMTEITIPASVTTIENLVFNKTQLTKVTYLGTTDPGANSTNVFSKAYPTIHVPADYIGTTFCKCTVTKAEATTDTNAIVVSATPAEGGSVAITVNGEPADKAKKDTVVTITVTENAGYVLKSLVAADADDGNIELTKDDNDDNKYTFTMPEKAVSVTAVFKEDSSLVYIGNTVLGIGTYYKCANNTLTSDETADDYNAYLTFNEATGYTLNIKNLTVSGVQNTNYGAGIYSANDDIALTINFAGTNIINGAENETNAAIYSLGDLNITGSGTLTAKGSTASSGKIKQSSGIAVVVGKSISITNANEVYANAGYANYSPSLSQGMRASNILIENSIVYAKGGQSIGQYGYSEGIAVVRGTLRIKGDGTKVEAISGDEGYAKNGISGNGVSNTLYLESGLLRVESKNATEYSRGITGIKLNMTGGIFEAVCGTATSATPIANPPTIAEELSIYDSKNNIIDYTNDYTIFKNYSFVRIAPSHIHEYSYTVDDTTITATCKNTDNNCYSTNGGYVTIAAPRDLTYTGSKIEAVVDNQLTTGDTVQVKYSADPISVGAYTASITLDGKEISVTYSIIAASIENATVTVNGTCTYDGAKKTPDIDVKLNGDTLTKDTDYTVSYANNVNAGTATVTVTGKGNYKGTATKTFIINAKPITVTIQNATSIYGEALAELKATDNGIVNGDKDVYKLTTNAGKTADVGKYDIIGEALDGNYSITFANETDAYEITTRELTVSVVVANKKYDGLNTAAITSAVLNNVANNDAVALVNGTATFTTVNVAENISIAFTDFALSGEADVLKNYTLTQPTGIKANITNDWTPTEYVVSTPNSNGWLNADLVITAADGYELSLTNTADGVWSETLTGAVEGADSSVTFYVRNKADGTISLAKTENYKLDKNTETTTTTGKVEFVERNSWQEFVNNITFGLFFKDEVTVKAEATDALSGVASIEYAVSDKALTLDEVKAITEWTAMPADGVAVTLEDTKLFVYFVRITDNAGNVIYLSTDGAEYDTTLPAISGIENGGIYYVTQKVTVTDKNLELDNLTLNDTPVTLDGNGSFTLTGNTDVQYKIVATDKAGNSTTVTVTMKAISTIKAPINDKTTDNIKSADGDTVQSVIDNAAELLTDPDITDSEKAELEQIKETAETLKDKIGSTAAESTDITDKVGEYKPESVKSDDTQDIKDLIGRIDTLLDGENLTEDEKAALEETKKAAEDLIKKVDDTAAESTDITDKVGEYKPESVKSDDTQDIKDLIGRIDTLLDGENLTEDEKAALEETKTEAQDLLDKIDEAANADDTDNTEAARDITTENVTPENKTDLEKAKEDLERTLDDYSDNLTEDEKKAIQTQIDRIDKAIAIIEKVEAVEELIGKLSENITKNDEDAIKAADEALGALSDYEKSLVDEDVKKALDDAKAALAELNKPADTTSPQTGDNTNIWMWFALLFVSGAGIFGITLYDRKRRMATKR